MRDVAERALAAFAWGGALFSLWAWWFARIGEPLDAGMAAWAALAVFIVDAWRRNGWKAARPSTRAYALAASGLAAYWVTRPFLPITLCGLFGVLGGVSLLVPATRDQGEFPAPLAGLAVAGLPTLFILDLFLGVPLRTVSTFMAMALLRLTGLEVVRNGMEIAVGGVPVWVDAPCAGVAMLGTGIVLALVLAQVWRLRTWRTVGVCSLAVVAVCLANAARVAVLTLCASTGLKLGSAAHEVVGGIALLAALLLVACVPYGRNVLKGADDVQKPKAVGWGRVLAMSVFFAVAVLCMLCRPEKFAQNFPGRIGRFRAGRRTVILRWTTRPTHRVHGAAYCLRATGWRIEPLPLEGDGAGAWSAFRATRGGETLKVREQVRGADGSTFADVPDWFFNALLGRTAGPWCIVTVAE